MANSLMVHRVTRVHVGPAHLETREDGSSYYARSFRFDVETGPSFDVTVFSADDEHYLDLETSD